MRAYLLPSPLAAKKWRIQIGDNHVDFGAKQYEDYTIHKDPKRMHLYIARHERNEDWTKSGVLTPGFWSRWLLWSEPSLPRAISLINQKFGIQVIKRG